MLYWLRDLEHVFGPFRLFRYLSFRSIGAVVTAFVVALVLGPFFIKLLKRYGARDKGRDFGGLNVMSKEGTPTMGGLVILAGLFISCLLWCDLASQHVRIVLAAAVYFGSIGALDDVLKIRRGSNEHGLSRTWKYASQIAFGGLVGVLFITAAFSPYDPAIARTLTVPIWKHGIHLGWWYMGFVIIFMVLSSNSVNITDGLDGLAIVPAMLVAAVLGVFAYVVGTQDVASLLRFGHLPGSDELTVFCCALFGAGAGFLWFNSHPASVFMGDTGSLALGGILGTLALLTKQEVVFFIAGGIFVVEAGSSFIQDYIGLKILGRRLFFRAPYHHSLLHQGYSETKVTTRFWILSVIFAAMALATLKLR
ncbi:phospho-N-acetylmuramoyl-pentapeptide-transferase [Planctomycetota bacterium]